VFCALAVTVKTLRATIKKGRQHFFQEKSASPCKKNPADAHVTEYNSAWETPSCQSTHQNCLRQSRPGRQVLSDCKEYFGAQASVQDSQGAYYAISQTHWLLGLQLTHRPVGLRLTLVATDPGPIRGLLHHRAKQ